MKKLLFILIFSMFNASLFAEFPWPCSDNSECPEGTSCNSSSNTCMMAKDKVVDYTVLYLDKGENNPNSRGSGTIFIPNPSKDLVLGQLAVKAGGDNGKIYFITDILVDISASSQIHFENFKLIYDENGNAVADSSEKVLAEGKVEGYGMSFELDQRYTAFKTNQTENFLIVGTVSADKDLPNDRFNIRIQGNKDYIKTKTYSSDAEVSASKDINNFPSFTFEPQSGYFLFASGRHFPAAPSWREINGEYEIMHLRLKALDGANELTGLTVKLDGNKVAFGNGVEKISLYIDSNNDGKGDTMVAELSDFTEPQQSVTFQIPSGKIAMNQGEEKFLTIKTALNFYNDQNTYFYISESDVALKNKQKIEGTTVKTDNFIYSCKEDNPDCRLKPEENQEEGGDSGCSLLFVD